MRKQLISFALANVALLLLVTTLTTAATNPRTIKAFNEGVVLANGGKYREAIPLFDEAIDRDADFAEAYYARAACKRQTQNVNGALQDLNRVLRLNPEHVNALGLRAAIEYEAESWDNAYQDFNAVLRLRPSDPQALLGRGTISLRKEDLATARQDFRQFLQVKPNDPVSGQVRRVLVSIDGSAPRPMEPSASRPSAGRSGRAMAESLKVPVDPMSDSFTQKVMRSQKGEAVGDLRENRSIPVEEGSK
jgi:tetratricopeptide (TPR) repeat protein